MLGWKNTSVALADLERLLICKICNTLVNDPCSLEACDHFFCRVCVQRLVGTDNKCPECGAFSWIKDLKTNRQLATTVALCLEMRQSVGNIGDNHTKDDPHNTDRNVETSSGNEIWENTEQITDDVTDTYIFPSPGDVDNADDDVDDDDQDDMFEQEAATEAPLASESCSNISDTNNANKTVELDCAVISKSIKSLKRLKKRSHTKYKAKSGILQYLQHSDTTTSNQRTDQLKCDDIIECPPIDTRGLETDHTAGSNEIYTAIKSSLATSICKEQGRTQSEMKQAEVGDEVGHQMAGRTRGSKRGVSPLDKTCNKKATLKIEEDYTAVISGREEDGKASSIKPRKRMNNGNNNMITPRKLKTSKKHPETPASLRGKSQKSGSPRTPQMARTLRGTPSRASGSPLLARRNKRGETPLHVAVIKGHIEDVKDLLNEGADPNTRDNAGWTPLHEACNHGHMMIAKLLLDNGALIDTPGGFDHDTPLHDAVANNKIEVARLLVTRGAPLDMRNKQGLLPSDYARTEQIKSALQETAIACSSTQNTKGLLKNQPQPTEETTKVILPTGLSTSQKEVLQKCIKKLGGQVVDQFSLEVSHVVTAVNENDVCPRTMKYLAGVLNGKWIVTFGWISKCLKNKRWEEEEPFEVQGTNDAQVDTPKRARINALKRVPGLFEGCSFYMYGGSFDPAVPSKEELAQLITYGGGKLLSREPRADDTMDALPSDNKNPSPLPTVAYHARPDSSQYWCTNYIIFDPLSDRKPKMINARHLCTAPFTWLLDCVSYHQILDVGQQ